MKAFALSSSLTREIVDPHSIFYRFVLFPPDTDSVNCVTGVTFMHSFERVSSVGCLF